MGRVKNNRNGYILVGGYDKDKYRIVTISSNGKQYSRRICRLAAIGFIPNPDNLPQVNHKDENRENDTVENLEWCTCTYNNNYGNRTQQTRKRVRCVELDKVYDGVRVAARELGISHQNIGKACGNGHTVGGYHWEYVI